MGVSWASNTGTWATRGLVGRRAVTYTPGDGDGGGCPTNRAGDGGADTKRVLPIDERTTRVMGLVVLSRLAFDDRPRTTGARETHATDGIPTSSRVLFYTGSRGPATISPRVVHVPPASRWDKDLTGSDVPGISGATPEGTGSVKFLATGRTAKGLVSQVGVGCTATGTAERAGVVVLYLLFDNSLGDVGTSETRATEGGGTSTCLGPTDDDAWYGATTARDTGDNVCTTGPFLFGSGGFFVLLWSPGATGGGPRDVLLYNWVRVLVLKLPVVFAVFCFRGQHGFCLWVQRNVRRGVHVWRAYHPLGGRVHNGTGTTMCVQVCRPFQRGQRSLGSHLFRGAVCLYPLRTTSVFCVLSFSAMGFAALRNNDFTVGPSSIYSGSPGASIFAISLYIGSLCTFVSPRVVSTLASLVFRSTV